jgi:hypothetical protein
MKDETHHDDTRSEDLQPEDATLLAALRELPRTAAPERDLWPGIEPRLAPRAAPRATLFGFRGWPVQMAAAVLLMVFGGVLSQLLWPSAASVPVASMSTASMSTASVPNASVPEVAPAGSGVRFELAETEYLRAKESLWLAVVARRDELSPVTLKVVERNLRIIDEAIGELRRALAEDPGNRHLESLLLANHRRSVELLRRLAHGAAEA